MKHTIETGLDKALSKKAIQKAMEAYKARFAEYNPRFDWKNDDLGEFGFTAKGISIGGTIKIGDKKMDVDMDVPFLFRIFQGRAMDVIKEQMAIWIDKAKKGEL